MLFAVPTDFRQKIPRLCRGRRSEKKVLGKSWPFFKISHANVLAYLIISDYPAAYIDREIEFSIKNSISRNYNQIIGVK